VLRLERPPDKIGAHEKHEGNEELEEGSRSHVYSTFTAVP
jgi:hypothetical protein